MSANLLATLGASIEPFVYVLGLWALRRRPLAFGLLACFGTLHREFTVFALPAFAVAGAAEWRTWGRRGLAQAVAGAGGLWVAIDLLKRQINTFGPGSAVPETGSLSLQAATIAQWISLDWPRYVGCLRDVVTTGLRDVFGAAPKPLADYAVNSTLSEGSKAAGVLFAGALLICGIRLAFARRRRDARPTGDVRLFLYLGIVAVLPLLAYGLNGGIQPGDPIVLRYLLFTLLLPVAVLGGFYARETRRRWQVTVGILVALWAGANIRDDARFAYEYETAPPKNAHRAMADYLTAKGVRYGDAIYWDAYAITFLARERVILASRDVVRIAAYQSEAAAHAGSAVTLVREPCSAGLHVSEWCVIGGPPELGGR
jgi:hypothetical protein